MNRDLYLSMLRSLDQALQICRESSDKLDEEHRRICADLTDARNRMLALLQPAPATGPAARQA